MVTASDFSKAVEDGLKLSKRLYADKPPALMEKFEDQHSHLPTAPMVYAVISDPAVVDNPDRPSYQAHVYSRIEPPALIPLHMNAIEMEVDCYLDTAFVKMSGSWRIHCVTANGSCHCRIAIPMGEQGSILGLEVEFSGKSYSTQLVAKEDNIDKKKAGVEFGGFLRPHIFTIIVPQVGGGSNLSVRASWSQKFLYSEGHFSLVLPFTFPEYVTAAGKKSSEKEKIHLKVNPGTGAEVFYTATSHPLKELRSTVGKLSFLYESEALTWSNTDISFSYNVPSIPLLGGVHLQSPSLHDVDQREMFCIYLLPGNQYSSKVFRKDVVFIVDISGSMQGKPLEDTKNVLYFALTKLNPEDSFSIITFNEEVNLFSASTELVTEESVKRAVEWISTNCIAGGGTNIFPPLNKAMEMLSNTSNSTPIIFLVTDGAVKDERHILDQMKTHLKNRQSVFPRLFTFGIGSFCNHYFLRMLATVGRGYYDASYDQDSVELRMLKLFSKASSLILTDICIESLDDLDDLEVYPSHIPDLSSQGPVTVFGRYHGNFPDTLKVKGLSADLSNHVIDLKIHNKVEDIPVDRISAKEWIDLLTCQAWYSEEKQLKEKVAKMSVCTGVVSEYTQMMLLENSGGKNAPEKVTNKTILIQSLGFGFGNLAATAKNISPGYEIPKDPEAAEIWLKAALKCCGRACDACGCVYCLHCCSAINNRCAIVIMQLCTASALIPCIHCCLEMCR